MLDLNILLSHFEMFDCLFNFTVSTGLHGSYPVAVE